MPSFDSADEYLSRLQSGLADRYRIEREIGSGGMAIVYLAHDLRHNRQVALKLLSPEITTALGAERFMREIRLCATLHHPHILPLFDSGEVDGLLFSVMPYVTGASLRERLNRDEQLPIDEAIGIATKLSAALQHAHDRGVIHRDIKPENILLQDGQPLLADFGIALALSEEDAARITSRGMSVGTPQYMSPEQATAERAITPASDIYSLGAVLYELLVGEPPVTGPSTKAIVARLLTETPRGIRTVRGAVSPAIESVVLKALAKDPIDRYQSAPAFAAALVQSLDAPSEEHRAVLSGQRAVLISSIAVLLLIVLGLTWWRVGAARAEEDTLRSVAILPCIDGSRSPSIASLGDRWTEELIDKLNKISDLRPKSWLSVNRYRDSKKTARQIGAELNAGSLARCRFAEDALRVKLSMQLIRSDDDRVIWSNDYDEPSGIAGENAAQSAAAIDIGRALKTGVDRSSAIAVGQAVTQDSAALRLYRLARHFYERGGVSDMYRSIDYFKQAVARDSTFALAYVGLADATTLARERELAPSVQYQPEVERYLRKALSIDETIPEAHSLLASYYSEYALDSISAEQQHRRAIQLNPNSVEAHVWYGLHLLTLEKIEPAIAEFQKAVALDPMRPLARGQLARALIFAGRHDQALMHLRAGMEAYPDWPMFQHLLAMSLVLRGKPDSAVGVLNRADKTPWNGWLYGRAGRSDTTLRILDSLTTESEKRPVDPVGIGVLLIGLGRRTEALAALERAYAERSVELRFYVGPHPAFIPLRNEPRFQALRRRVGLSQ